MIAMLPTRFIRRLHNDERGTISIISVLAILLFKMLLGMVINVGRHVDDKVKMQNAADAASYSGGCVLARGMNTLAYSNHLLCDVFALTAFMRESRDRNAESLTPEVLAAWSKIGPIFSQSSFPKFAALGPAITQKVPLEQDVVSTYSEMSAHASAIVLPVLEYILRDRLIPRFQRVVVQTIPNLAQQAMTEAARRHGATGQQVNVTGMPTAQNPPPRAPQAGVLWRTRVQPVGLGGEADPIQRTLPAIDPDPTEGSDYYALPYGRDDYLARAVQERRFFAHTYLDLWNNDRLQFFPREAKMSQFFDLWQVFTCGQLEKLLLIEYPLTNLPHMMRLTDSGQQAGTLAGRDNMFERDTYLERHFMFVGVVYREPLRETFPGLFVNPLAGTGNGGPTAASAGTPVNAMTFAQTSLFIPRARMWIRQNFQAQQDGLHLGGTWGWDGGPPSRKEDEPGGQPLDTDDVWVGENWPARWDLWNQNWMTQLVPATADSLIQILQTPPPSAQIPNPRVLSLGGATPADLRRVNMH